MRLTADWGTELERAAVAPGLNPKELAELYPQLPGPVSYAALAPPAAVDRALAMAGAVEPGAGS